MIKSKGIFAVSFIAMMVVGGAYANIASQGYVDQQVDAKQNASTAVKVATAGTAVGDATHPVYVNASGVATRIDKVAAAASADTATSATKATQDASGNVITTTYATKSELTSGLAGKQNSLGYTAENSANKVKSVRAASSATDTAYPSEKAVATALATKVDTSALSGYATTTDLDAVEEKADAAASAASNAQNTANAKVATAQGSGNANKAVITNSSGTITTGTISSGMIANDAVTAAKIATGAVGTDGLAANAVTSAKIADGTIVNADIASNAAIAASKISGLATVATTGSYNDLANKPTIPAAITVDSALSSTSTNPVQNKVVNAAINAAQSTADDAASAASAAQSTATAAQNAINNLDVSTASGSGNVVTSVTQTNGKIAVTKGNVQIPVGSATAATSYATIWVQ